MTYIELPPPTPPSIRRRVIRALKIPATAMMKRSPAARQFIRRMLNERRTKRYTGFTQTLPLNNKKVVFESFMGRSYSDSPKAIFEAMKADPRFADFELVWSFKGCVLLEEGHDFPSGAKIVIRNSEDYYSDLASAKYWVTNSRMHDHLFMREGQYYLQCWHGTPLKRLGHDIEIETENALNTSGELAGRYAIDASRYSAMLSPSPYASEKFRSAFGLEKLFDHDIMLEVGYPRNDILKTYDPTQVAELKIKLGIPKDKKVMLYAPTWRDNQHSSATGYTYKSAVDFDKLQAALGEDWVILFRAHYFISNIFDFEKYKGFIINASGVDDINECYLVSDALVTDYSSVFFDYANLQRPMIFYMYDLEEYKHKLRGFYIDLSELPGPIVENEDEFISEIGKLNEYWERFGEQYKVFSAKFNPLDDGQAAARVVDALWENVSKG